MAGGGGEGDDNPVPVNCVALIDIIFCLCIFFMCSLHFKQLEGKMESWLPKDRGAQPSATKVKSILDEIRVTLRADERGAVTRSLGAREVGDDAELRSLLEEEVDAATKLRPDDARVEVDAEPRVPWKHVLRVIDICGPGAHGERRSLAVELAAPKMP
jgi:biopolymer transport protein ExbD